MRVFFREIFGYLRVKARAELGLAVVRMAHDGAVTSVHRSSGKLDLNLHIHCGDQRQCLSGHPF